MKIKIENYAFKMGLASKVHTYILHNKEIQKVLIEESQKREKQNLEKNTSPYISFSIK